MRTDKAEKKRNLERVLKEKENNKYENQIEVLRKVRTLDVNFQKRAAKIYGVLLKRVTQ